MKRLKWLLCAVAAVTAGMGSVAQARDAMDRPNVIFILADDLGWSDVGYNGHPFFETPNIDQLVADGIKFDEFHSGGPNCAPSRACLMTGMYGPRTHLYTPGGKSKGPQSKMRLSVPGSNGAGKKEFQSNNDTIAGSITCVPEVIQSQGYVTARLGKWHLGKNTQGFDISSADGSDGPNAKHYGSKTVAESLTDAACKFIEKNQDRPFFLYFCHWDVHGPIRAKQTLVNKYEAKNKRMGTSFNPAYAGMVEQVDRSVQRVRAKVEELGLEKNTLILFSSDNGGCDKYTSNKPLKGVKGSLFEGGVRVPGAAYWKGVIAPGSVSKIPVTGVDLLPTVAELAGAPLPTNQPVDGRSFVPLLTGAPHNLADRAIFWHFPLYLTGVKEGALLSTYGTDDKIWRAKPASAIRKGDWKLIWYFEDNSTRLYNIAEDPYEQHDLSQSNPEMLHQLMGLIKQWQSDTDAPVPSKRNPKFKKK